eukprot:CAMPEP_0183348238 /NCGR_PEP_ID=MMETSP0164_2-20130417/12812_1 /TAXON_ID=221442 /ORGANISM="Coccolithus pelagicus ssp braarudi, Strain PLY182g" /LENGTH=204 /DNA_ID=CAMNT_0025519795 /DNA_START=150 /DNA_END=761 /DNA_ORIENTATION=-
MAETHEFIAHVPTLQPIVPNARHRPGSHLRGVDAVGREVSAGHGGGHVDGAQAHPGTAADVALGESDKLLVVLTLDTPSSGEGELVAAAEGDDLGEQDEHVGCGLAEAPDGGAYVFDDGGNGCGALEYVLAQVVGANMQEDHLRQPLLLVHPPNPLLELSPLRLPLVPMQQLRRRPPPVALVPLSHGRPVALRGQLGAARRVAP